MSGHGAFAAALLDPDRQLPAGLRAWNGSDPTLRFNVHRNNVLASLIEALATTFPVIQALVGVDFFRALASMYARQLPPVSRILFEYGRDFPDFVARSAPAGDYPYLADIGRLEYSRVEAFHAADAEALDGDAFRSIQQQPQRLFDARARLHPACRILRSSHAVFSIWAAHQGLVAIESVALGQPEDVLVFRPAHEVRVLALPPGGAAFLDSLASRRTLGESASIAGKEAGFDLAANLRGLVEHALAVELG